MHYNISVQIALDGLARLFCMPYEQLDQSRQKRRQEKLEQRNAINLTDASRKKTQKVYA